jgi:hypothetical protein
MKSINLFFENHAGGPGSGKIFHCQQLASRIPGVVHLNMSDLLLQHAGRHGEFINITFY